MTEPEILIAASMRGLTRAERDPAGEWWVRPVSGVRAACCVCTDPADRSRLLCGTAGDGVHESLDRGVTWRRIGLAGMTVRSLAISAASPGLVLAGTRPAGICFSRDGGTTWNEMRAFRQVRRPWWLSPDGPPFAASVEAISTSPVDPGVVVVGIGTGAVVASLDGGATWTGHRPGALRACHNIHFHPDGEHVYEAGSGGASTSADGGVTWRRHTAGLDRRFARAVSADAVDAGEWYVAAAATPLAGRGERSARAAIYRARGDEPWELLAGGLPQPLRSTPCALMPTPARSGALTAALTGGEVWHSRTHGESWRRLPVRLGRSVRQVVALFAPPPTGSFTTQGLVAPRLW